MEIHVDRFGRVVIPKAVRSHLGLQTGAALEVEERPHELRLRPVHAEPTLLLKGGVLVFTGTAAGEVAGAVRTHREERLSRFARQPRR